MNRKDRRALERKMKKGMAMQDEQAKTIQNKMSLFSKLPDQCLTCEMEFDKTDKEQVTTWKVFVRGEDKKVNLYCPDCWGKASEIVEAYFEAINNNFEDQQDEEKEDES